jgi:protoheme IX farnesyltransferase
MHTAIRDYLLVTKPGIVFGNLISVLGAFLLASRGHVDAAALLSTTVGISLVIASACVLNNRFDRSLDRVMTRTRNRALAAGRMSPGMAACYAAALGASGAAVLLAANNLLSVSIVLAGFAIYAGLYSLYLKRHSGYATVIGSLAGAAPPLAGYCAVSNRFDAEATILLAMFSLWQMPHFYAIAIYRLDDYVAAAIPALPATRGIAAARKRIIGYILAFIAAAVTLTGAGHTGYGYLAAAVALGTMWLACALHGYDASDQKRWARRLFFCSLLVIFVLSFMMGIDYR